MSGLKWLGYLGVFTFSLILSVIIYKLMGETDMALGVASAVMFFLVIFGSALTDKYFNGKGIG